MRSLIGLVAVWSKSKCIAGLYTLLGINDLLGAAAIVILHIYRFEYSGKYCSGDYLATSNDQPYMLVARGKYLLGLVIYTWVGLFTYACIQGCIFTALARRNKYEALKNQ